MLYKLKIGLKILHLQLKFLIFQTSEHNDLTILQKKTIPIFICGNLKD